LSTFTDVQHEHCWKKAPKSRKSKKGGAYIASHHDYLLHTNDWVYRLDGVMVTVLAPSAEDWEFDPRSGQAKDYHIA
jgi:hypothetical protein